MAEELKKRLVVHLRERLIRELGFEEDKEEKYGIYKGLNDNFGMVFYYTEEEDYYFGLYHFNDKGFSPTQKSKLKDILSREEYSHYFSNELTEWEKEWLVKKFDINNFDGDLEEAVNYFLIRYKLLELTVSILEI
jgi:hypothetical protein